MWEAAQRREAEQTRCLLKAPPLLLLFSFLKMRCYRVKEERGRAGQGGGGKEEKCSCL